MIPESRIPTHPGEILVEEFLEPEKISQATFARKLQIPLNRVNEIVKGKRGVTADTAWKFSLALGTTPEFWMSLQSNRDLALARPKRVGPKRAARVGTSGTATIAKPHR